MDQRKISAAVKIVKEMPLIQTNGIDFYYEEHGFGEPLLLIMGITATGSVWEKHLAHWKKYFRCWHWRWTTWNSISFIAT